MSNYTHVNGASSGNGANGASAPGHVDESEIPRSERGSSVMSMDSDKSRKPPSSILFHVYLANTPQVEAADAATNNIVNACRELLQFAPVHEFLAIENPALANAIEAVRALAQTVVCLAEHDTLFGLERDSD